jgi:hypothetical protein
MTTSMQAPAGWYTDPSDAAQYRWFDGNAWTSHVQSVPAVPVPAASPQVSGQSSYGQAAYYQPSQAQIPYGQPTYAKPGYAQQQATGGCQQCGAVPAMSIKLHGHVGMVILQRFLTYRGRFCRDCGISRFRTVQKQLMLLGWWGFISFFVTIVNIGQNLFTFSRLRSLGAAQNRMANPAAPGSSVFASPGFAVSLVIAVFVGVALFR